MPGAPNAPTPKSGYCASVLLKSAWSFGSPCAGFFWKDLGGIPGWRYSGALLCDGHDERMCLMNDSTSPKRRTRKGSVKKERNNEKVEIVFDFSKTTPSDDHDSPANLSD